MSERKCVIVVDPALPPGVMANSAAVVAASLGRLCPEIIGEDLPDHHGRMHAGITTLALPVLGATAERLKALREQLRAFEPGLAVVDLISATRTTRSYAEYAQALARGPDGAIRYQALGLLGERKLVTRLTGSLGLLR
ncbi:MAG TPA: DUF2000 domain-containing protein [Pseudoxanthomonas sp.]|nr:DUF2000 domain-containing protein [Pseudoxanthomonas sp.]